MAILPISDYPAPASDKSQAQVLTERKAELNQRLQTLQQSALPAGEKERISASIGDQIHTTEQQRQHKLREASNKEKQQSAEARQVQQAQAVRLEDDDARAKARRSLDTRA
ncbi:hypothetical protein [Ethanoligenens harbinense]|uniref:Uncharacterized protein n=1 Tax=Ethanoligenens harbinense (strain DSM 18485 / JCM 12961 / CGMCC 1.5033 / YUAN-3) TaxID=663278 RepID=E6U463_ETHHY|nr:hypothetical protein [Ethanoligenens harbinense]ADU26563.1 hypothetical protein Ethha_1010 [Ethanoligenens harbinense YUAN-3]AVQ95689.1 hypothetical protein CXQ68_05235 [Ethanoligenens harbinense YUAN-3]AYF38352.1 hypothetical protein CXP51_05095 [Ethanoligenens harbinense]AYF41097.1 hypothetical protein CN246_05225 [Ethanoligenens harbinense]QCN91928.1 hypothetical protein DRA42_05250 [Ethanoligenens harbinense]